MSTRLRPDLDSQPIRVLRKKYKYTIKEAAEEAGINWQAWFLAENGCYTDVLPAIVNFFYTVTLYNGDSFRGDDLKEHYRRWVFHKRNLFQWPFLDLGEVDTSQDPVGLLIERLGLDRTSFAKALCIQPAILYKVSKAAQRSLPEQLKNALLESGFGSRNIDELQERYEEFYERVHFKSFRLS